MAVLAGGLVFMAGLFLLGLGVTGLARPAVTASFYQGFAQSAVVHYGEQSVRILVGLACLGIANSTTFPNAFWFVGLVLVITSTLLLFVPWRWHRRFADHVIPMVIRYQPLYAIGALGLGLALLGGLATALFG